MHDWKTDEAVAVLPAANSPVTDVLEIANVKTVNSVFVQLANGRYYSTIGGKSLLADKTTYIRPATDAHRKALRKS